MQQRGIRESAAGCVSGTRRMPSRIPACGLPPKGTSFGAHPGYKKLKSIFVASKNSMTAKIFFSVAPGVR